MCDETPGVYKEGDIVWVKLQSRWWPGQVRELNNVPVDIRSTFKKDPLVTVRFFDEDSYEFVRNWSNIYPYNCDRKDEFIKKGMDAFRAKVSHMEKFPKDVSTAEVKTQGNPNILSCPQFAPEKKTNYSALFFGETSTKKKDTPKKRLSQNKSLHKGDISHITHRRFLGYDDYEAHIRIQYPGKDREDSKYSDDENSMGLTPSKERRTYTCTICKFVTDCLEVIVLHNTSHIQGVYKPVTTSKKPKKSLFKKDKAKKSQKPKTSTSAQVTAEVSSDEENDSEKKGKRKRKPQGQSKSSKQRKIEEEKPKTSSDIRSDLLAEWEDVSDTEQDTTQEQSLNESADLNDTVKTNDDLDITHKSSEDMFDTSFMDSSQDIGPTPETTLDETSFSIDKVGELPKDALVAESTPMKEASTLLLDDKSESQKIEAVSTEPSKPVKKSCFDFDEEEEESVATIIAPSTTGRKIPRVIPPTEKRLSMDLDSASPGSPLVLSDSEDSHPKRLTQSDENCSASSMENLYSVKDNPESQNVDTISNEGSTVEKNGVSCGSQDNEDNLETAFSELLESTSIPDLPDIPNTLKCEQNFHCAKTIKFPDKTDPPKLPVDQKSAPSKTSETTNVATKLTNPKKRFVKSFEDFELLQNEQKRIALEEKKDSTKQSDFVIQSVETEKYKSSVADDLSTSDSQGDSGNKFRLESDVNTNAKNDNNFENKFDNTSGSSSESFAAPSTNLTTESQIEKSPVKFSTLRTQVMSKLQDSKAGMGREQDFKYDIPPKVRRASASHRTPRSKILESYRNEQSGMKLSETVPMAAENTEQQPVEPESCLPKSSSHPEPSSHQPRSDSSELSNTATPAKSTETHTVPSESVVPPLLNIDTDLESASQYCFKKKKYSKLSRALSRDKEDFRLSFESNDSMSSDKQSQEVKEKSSLASAAPTGVNTLLCSIPLPEEKDLLLPEIAKVLDQSFSSKDHVPEKKIDSEPAKEKCPETPHEADLISQTLSTLTDNGIVSEQPTNENQINVEDSKKTDDAKLVEQQTATEMEKLFSGDDQSLFPDNITSVAASEAPIIPTTKPEFSSTSELMMELADGDKSSSADEDSILSLAKSDHASDKSHSQHTQSDLERHTSADEAFSDKVDQHPPVDSPKLPEKAPNLPEEAPKLPEKAPNLPEEAPKLPEEAPKLPEEAPKLPEEAPKLPEETPKLPEEEAPKHSDTPKDIVEETSQPETETMTAVLIEPETDDKPEETHPEQVQSQELPSQEKVDSVDDYGSVKEKIDSAGDSGSAQEKVDCADDSGSVKEKVDSADDSSSVKEEKVDSADNSSSVKEKVDSADASSSVKEKVDGADDSGSIKDPSETLESFRLAPSDFGTEVFTPEIKETDIPFTPDTIERDMPKSEQVINVQEQLKVEQANMAASATKDNTPMDQSENSELSESEESVNTVHFKYAAGKDDVEFDISIQTNLSNFTNNDELSALTTLATVSQLKDDIETGLMLQKSEKSLLDQGSLQFQDNNLTQVIETADVPMTEQITAEMPHIDEADAKVFHPATNLAPTMSEIIESAVKSDILQSTLMKNRESPPEPTSEVDSKLGYKSDDVSEMNSERNKAETVTKIDEVESPVQQVYPIGPVEIPPNVRELNESSVPIDKNLTVVSEKDLADGQVEITSTATKNPVTLTSFSLDFSDTSSDNVISLKESRAEENVRNKATHKIKLDTKKTIPATTTPSSLHPTNIITKSNVDFGAKSSEFNVFTKRKMKTMVVLDAVCDLEEHIPPQIVCAKDAMGLPKDLPKLSTDLAENNAPKRLEMFSHKEIKIPASQIQGFQAVKLEEREATIIDKSKSPKFIIKSKVKQGHSAPVKPHKPIILSEKIIKPAADAESVSVQKITSKRTYQDVEDIDTFIIQKSKKPVLTKDPAPSTASQNNIMPTKGGGKAKILQQTIITAAGEIIQPSMNQSDDNVFDINSMPIVLSDDLLTPESIEKMPIVLSDTLQSNPAATTETVTTATPTHAQQIKKSVVTQQAATILNKSLSQTSALQSALSRAIPNPKVTKTAPKILQSTTGRLIKHTSPSMGKGNKYIILPQTPTVQEAKPILKKTLIKKGQSVVVSAPQTSLPEPTGNKIMIVTNQQGQKQRLLLTPSHQKLLTQGSRLTKTIVKGNVLQKSVLAPKAGQTIAMSTVTSGNLIPAKPTSSGLLLTTSSGQLAAATGQVATTIGQFGAIKNIKVDPKTTRKIPMQQIPKPGTFTPITKPVGQQKTVLLKNQHGQTIRKFQNTDEALLEKQVAEQIQAIKASNMKSQQKAPELTTYKTPKTALKRSYSKRQTPQDVTKQNVVVANQASTSSSSATVETAVPPLAPLAPKRTEASSALQEVKQEPKKVQETDKKAEPQRPLNQLVIQDAMGNQTTITEGQILALPSETVDGQPQSYMLVTLDESGNLTPLNSEALMSLDPNLNLGGDLSNMVLQIDQSSATSQPEPAQRTVPVPAAKPEPVVREKITAEKKTKEKETIVAQQPSQVASVKTTLPNTNLKTVEMMPPEQQATSAEVAPPVTCNVGGEPGQQLIVTGDPLATQKFLESLSEGTTDLANILANAEGGSILIHADGQQILINTDSDNQNLLLSVNTDNVGMSESTEGGGNPIFATQPKKNKDILAAALAGTDVFQQEQSSVQNKVGQSQLSPNSSLYPMNVGNVLEPTLTLSSPIMTPLEVPSTNSKKITDDEADILGHVPKNVDLPITITDPNISQTVAHQQVASLIANELQSNLELPLPISDASMTVAPREISSPSFVYTLPTFDDSVEITPKSFNSSMPLLTEESVETSTSILKKEKPDAASDKNQCSKSDLAGPGKVENLPRSKFHLEIENSNSSDKIASVMHSDGSLMEEEGLCTLGGEMCTSLSEPPPDMFELDTVNSDSIPEKTNETTDGEIVGKVVEVDSSNAVKEDSIREALMGDDRVTTSEADQVTPDSTSVEVSMVNEDSCEIPILPQIVTDLSSEQSVSSSESERRNMVQHEGNDNT